MSKDRRLFARFDLDYADHPKIAALSDAAFRAHVELILYARKYMTDGVIGNRVANRLGSRWDADVLTELLTNDEANPSLSVLPNGDYLLHGFADMQETRAEIESRTARNRENGRRGGRPKTQSKTQSVTESVTKSGTQKKAEIETEIETEELLKASCRGTADAVRPDVAEVLDYLDTAIAANGARVPRRTKTNQDAARLLIDKDGRTIEQIKTAIDYATSDEFWRANILSMSKLREKYDTLRLSAQRSRTQATAPRRETTDDRVRAGLELAQRLAQREQTHPQIGA